MLPLEKTGRPHAAIGVDQPLTGLDDESIATGLRARGEDVERAKKL
jgi:hypothetical protein